MYTMVKTRIDIVFTISIVSQFAKNPSSEDFNIINQILQYLAESPDKGITFEENENLKLIKYLDSDWAGDHSDSKSISKFIFLPNSGLISYIYLKNKL